MIIIFDLDDTLYQEETYVFSGYRALSLWISNKFNLNKHQIFKYLLYDYKHFGRGKNIDRLLYKYKIFSINLLNQSIKIYRHHNPKIILNKNVRKFLYSFKKEIYLLTDGHKITQQKKIKILNIQKYFKKIYITHNYGIKYEKPSLYCFNKIKIAEKCNWSDMVYIGDNPEKDFINLNNKGAKTVRIISKQFQNYVPKKNFDAIKKINLIEEFKKIKW